MGTFRAALGPTYPIISANGLCESCSRWYSSRRLPGFCPCQPSFIKIKPLGGKWDIVVSLLLLLSPPPYQKETLSVLSVLWELGQTLFCLSQPMKCQTQQHPHVNRIKQAGRIISCSCCLLMGKRSGYLQK